jgi:DNA-binding LytR/AlgR family response regulator/two-component sensor histidine kinase
MLGEMSSRWKHAIWLFAFANVFALLEFSYHYLDLVAMGWHQSPWRKVIEEFTGAYTFFLFFPLIVRMTRQYPIGGRSGLRNVPVHALLVLAFGIASTSIQWVSRSFILSLAGFGAYDYGHMPTRYFMEFPQQAVSYWTLLALTLLYDRQTRQTALEKSLAKAQLQNLRLQLQPHFLFNTLNTISSVMYEDVRVADRMIARLSDLLRLSLEQGSAQEVPLGREFEFLNLYVETMQARFEERLTVVVDADEEARRAMVPPLVLQPLLENSIRHGADSHNVVQVEVSARRQNGSLMLEVRDHGPGINGKRDGIGLSNTVERLERLYGGSGRMDLHNDGGLVVTLKFPIMSIRALLVDDERPARRKMMRFLEAADDFEIAGEAEDGPSALAAIARFHPDVVFLDVQMPKMDGFQVAAALEAPPPEIVVVTAHDQFALKAFEANALDYLLKPYDEDRFRRVLDRVRARRRGGQELTGRIQRMLASVRYPDRVLVTENGRSFFMPIAEVDWLEGARNYVVLHARGKTHTMRATLDGISKKLDPSAFVRVNRSTIVRLDSIHELQPWFHGEYKIVMKDGATVTWSRKFVTAGFPERVLR